MNFLLCFWERLHKGKINYATKDTIKDVYMFENHMNALWEILLILSTHKSKHYNAAPHIS